MAERPISEYAEGRDEYGHPVIGPYTILHLKVAGVTFKNGRRNRQTILRQIRWKEEPYQKVVHNDCLDFVATEYEGAPAVEVWVRSKKAREQIGYIPKEEAEFFAKNIQFVEHHMDFEVYGGGDGRSYGASFSVRFVIPGVECYKDGNEELEQEPQKPDPHKRAFELYKQTHSKLGDITFWPMEDEKPSIVIYKNKVGIEVVKYDETTDSIQCVKEERERRKREEVLAKKKRNGFAKWIVVIVILGMITYMYLNR